MKRGGQLTEAVRRRPYAVILFDEIEKAHHDVFNALLQILDDGRLTDGQGRVVNFRNTIIIMSSNIGSALIAGLKEKKAVEERIHEALKGYFRPEFLNRIDEVVIFNRLSAEDIRRIVDIHLCALQNRLKDRHITLELTDEAKDRLSAQGFDPEYGARPLKRVIQKLIQDPLAFKLLQGEFKEKDSIRVDVEEGKFIFKVDGPKDSRQRRDSLAARC